MPPHERAHDQLFERALALARRLERLEGELRHHEGLAPSESAAREVCPILGELIETGSAELDRIRESLRHIAAGGFDVCARCGAELPDAWRTLHPDAVHCATCAPDLDSDPMNRMRSQHVGLRQLLASLEGVMASLDESAAPLAGARSAALVLLTDLERELGHHFELEETGGSLAEALRAAPRHQRRARGLLEQHASFRKDIAVLVEQGRRVDGGAEAWQSLTVDLNDFIASLLAHERVENEILADALLSDQGGG